MISAFLLNCFNYFCSDWATTVISRVSLPDAIQCWEVTLDSANEENIDVIHDDSANYHSVDSSRHYSQGELYNGGGEERETNFASAEMGHDDDDDEYSDSYYATNYLNDTPEPNTISPSQCRQKLIDPCPLPQCNPTCRSLYDPHSQSRINSVDFLERIGINLRAMANKKGFNAAQLMEELSRG